VTTLCNVNIILVLTCIFFDSLVLGWD